MEKNARGQNASSGTLNPEEEGVLFQSLSADGASLIIACGALAREILAILNLNNLNHMTLTCLPASLHNRPQEIPARLREKIKAGRKQGYQNILVAYADCGTGGIIDKVIEEEKAIRIAGPHCYAFFSGLDAFDAIQEQELGTLYLTDYLARHFETLIIKGMGIDRHPELQEIYFANYKRLVYLAQTEDEALKEKAKKAAEGLGLAYHYHFTGYGLLTDFISKPSPDDSSLS